MCICVQGLFVCLFGAVGQRGEGGFFFFRWKCLLLAIYFLVFSAFYAVHKIEKVEPESLGTCHPPLDASPASLLCGSSLIDFLAHLVVLEYLGAHRLTCRSRFAPLVAFLLSSCTPRDRVGVPWCQVGLVQLALLSS